MNFRGKQKESPDVNITPLIDVVFLLLIFFMVSTTFKDNSEIEITLPKASQAPQETLPQSIELTIDAEGQYYVNQQRLVNTQLETIKRALKQVAGEQESPVIIIKADAKTPHQAVISAMDAARQLGFSKLGFATITATE